MPKVCIVSPRFQTSEDAGKYMLLVGLPSFAPHQTFNAVILNIYPLTRLMGLTSSYDLFQTVGLTAEFTSPNSYASSTRLIFIDYSHRLRDHLSFVSADNDLCFNSLRLLFIMSVSITTYYYITGCRTGLHSLIIVVGIEEVFQL